MKRILYWQLFPLVWMICLLGNMYGQSAGNDPKTDYYYGNDVIIHDQPLEDQQNLTLDAAFNGWLFAAYSFISDAGGTGNFVIMRSTDHGQTWEMIYSQSTSYIHVVSLDMAVAGNTLETLKVYLAMITFDYTTGTEEWVVGVSKFNGSTGAFEGNVYAESNGTFKFYDVAIATDCGFPAVGASPYSLGLAFARHNPNYDDVIFLSSNGGALFSNRYVVGETEQLCREVSVAYARSADNPDGCYFVTWDEFESEFDWMGNIFVSHSYYHYQDPFLPAFQIDALSPLIENACHTPRISCQVNNSSNMENGLTAILAFESGAFSGENIIRYAYNFDAVEYDNWDYYFVTNWNVNETQPELCFEPSGSFFYITFFSTMELKLATWTLPLSFEPGITWTLFEDQYNDVTDLDEPYPMIAISPVYNEPAHAWIMLHGTNIGRAMFDAAYLPVGMDEPGGMVFTAEAWPNPCHGELHFSIRADENIWANICVYSSDGQMVYGPVVKQITAGCSVIPVMLSQLPVGIYFWKATAGEALSSGRILVKN